MKEENLKIKKILKNFKTRKKLILKEKLQKKSFTIIFSIFECKFLVNYSDFAHLDNKYSASDN